MSERISAESYRGLVQKDMAKGTGRIKGASPTVVDGIRFASRREARRWGELRLLERAGHIRDLKRQVPIPLLGDAGPILTPTGRPMRYVADFSYSIPVTGTIAYEDAKGHPTDTYKMKRAILAAMGVEVREI